MKQNPIRHFLAGFLVIASCPAYGGTSNPSGDATERVVASSRLSASYAGLPLYFEPNLGQTDRRVNFIAHGSGCQPFLTPTEVVLSLSRVEPATPMGNDVEGRNRVHSRSRTTSFIRVKLVGADQCAKME